jgi:hypothetical protein
VGTARSDASHPDTVERWQELRVCPGLARGDDHAHRQAAAVNGQVDFVLSPPRDLPSPSPSTARASAPGRQPPFPGTSDMLMRPDRAGGHIHDPLEIAAHARSVDSTRPTMSVIGEAGDINHAAEADHYRRCRHPVQPPTGHGPGDRHGQRVGLSARATWGACRCGPRGHEQGQSRQPHPRATTTSLFTILVRRLRSMPGQDMSVDTLDGIRAG